VGDNPVSDTFALLLKPIDSLRFVPNANADGRANIEFRTWDGTGGIAGMKVDSTVVGGAFSVDGGSASIDITPELETSTAAVLDFVDTGDPTTTPVTFASLMSPIDIDGGDVGVAIIATRGPKGTWQYSTDGGTTMLPLGVVSPLKALFLNPSALIQFTTDPLALPGTATLLFKAWNNTKNVPGTRGVASLANTSRNIEFLTVAVGNLSEPDLDTTPNVVLPGVKVTPKPGIGVFVSKLLTPGALVDVSKSVKGVAIVGLSDNGYGKWQYYVGGTVWLDFGTVSETSAILLTTANRIRFVPNAGTAAGAIATIEYKAWDGTTGQSGDRIDTTSALLNSFSDNVEIATISVVG
jgi:hypothetical protein